MQNDFLLVDTHTFKDLDIFGSETSNISLFSICNRSQTKGGAKALRRRMEHPWSSASNIKATQDSLYFILEHRHAFTKLPTAYATSRTDKYLNEALPMVTHSNALEFGLGAFSLWSNHKRYYYNILSGVQVTCGMIQALRQFIAQPKLLSSNGELAFLIEEMNALLEHADLSRLPDEETGGGIWKTLRFDQILRIHEKISVKRLLQLIYEIDALVAMADTTRAQGFVIPTIKEGPTGVQAEGLIHPFLDDAVPNPVAMDQTRRVLFLTGPNMAGKTTYLRAFATALYLAHLGMGVPAKEFCFVPVQQLFSSISLNDDLQGGVSYFRAEALRVKAIAQALSKGYRVVAVMDEPFKGTNVKDALDASLAMLNRFATMKESLFLFSSHLIEIEEQLKDTNHIDCRFFEAEESEGRLRFNYQLHQGVSNQRLGMRVLREEGIFQLLDDIDKNK